MTTLIIGGGLSGLALAEALEAQGRDYLLLEARARLGGRIKTEQFKGGAFDMGPAWFWPGQPRIAAMIKRFGLQKFDQFAAGAQSFEDEHGQVQRGQGIASMEGSWRLKGGLSRLIDALADRVPEHRRRLNTPVGKLSQTPDGISATLSTGETLQADRVVLAMPPRIAAHIEFSPALPSATLETMQGVATWMAGQAKAVAIYDTPFWRNAGLSGDVMSRTGPMVEIHDASPAAGGPYALFGFIGVPPQGRKDNAWLHDHLLIQLVRLFGPAASAPTKLYIKDWAFDPYTATQADNAPLYAHPTYGLADTMTQLWHTKLQFAGTEVAPHFGGYIEGALEAAENALDTLNALEGT